MVRYVTVVLGVVALVACGVPDPPRTLPATLDANSLPAAARVALDASWPKAWSVATLSPQTATCLSGKAGTVVTSDLDSDLATDLAAAVTTPQGIRLVALLARDDHYALFNIDAIPGESGAATQGLGLGKRGVEYTKANTIFTDFYSTDTLTLYSCAGPVASYIWSGLSFYKVDLTAAKASR